MDARWRPLQERRAAAPQSKEHARLRRSGLGASSAGVPLLSAPRADRVHCAFKRRKTNDAPSNCEAKQALWSDRASAAERGGAAVGVREPVEERIACGDGGGESESPWT